jgi:hypothetical protein
LNLHTSGTLPFFLSRGFTDSNQIHGRKLGSCAMMILRSTTAGRAGSKSRVVVNAKPSGGCVSRHASG